MIKKILLNAKEAKKFISQHKNIRILDCPFTKPVFPNEKEEIFIQERIPKATFFDIDYVCDQKSLYPHMLPSLENFKSFMKELDISKNDEILLYDDFGMIGSCRAHWMFKVFGVSTHILNGGLNAWKKENYDLEIETETYKKRGNLTEEDLNFEFHQELVKNKEQIDQLSKQIVEGNQGIQLIDFRNAERFYGKVPEPRPEVGSGNIPGSKLLFFKDLLTEDWALKNLDDLKKTFSKNKVDLNDNLILTCGSGSSSAIGYLALTLLGKKEKLSIYDGSWSEYGWKKNQ